MMTYSIQDKVVLLTGVSSGLGKVLAERLLNAGARVAGTFRKPQQAADFEKTYPGKALGIVMDITNNAGIQTGVDKVVAEFGRIDVLANNAGVGTVGAIEETSDDEARKVFDVNFFGGLSLIRAVLPHMRKQRSGRILQFSAIGGFIGVPGLGVYTAAKAATDILGETLAKELQPFNIHTTVLTIGVFHTEFAGGSLNYTDAIIDDYAPTPAGQFRAFIGNLQGKQPNDPVKGADAIVALIETDTPPVHAALGGDAMGGMRSKMAEVEKELAAWEANALSTAKA
ncbi:SDR family NAD(P)-dependent oxidoreductase [Alteromonas gracilis]|uniref:SDR family NAD(P)-dependent oxidoreductase n=1 Tax=Alteromonas gracilis TaxID=1479524 RepID=UPI003736EC2E